MSTLYVVTAHHKHEALGLHHLSNHHAILPWSGGYGRLTEERCRAARLIFPDALAAADAIHPFLREDCLWTLAVAPLQAGADVLPSAMPPKKELTWQEQIDAWTPAQLVELLGCPQATVYAWTRKNEPRQPPAWQQPILLAYLIANSGRYSPLK